MSGPDVFRVAGLEVSFQRLGRRAWSTAGLLRSWGAAPWRSVPGGVAVACLADEALWLGLTTTAEPATVRLETADGAWVRELAVPPDWQLGWLCHDAETQPIALAVGAPCAGYRLRVMRASSPATQGCDLELLAPGEWRKRFGPLELAPAKEPPPVGRYSRVVPPGE
jgi:hypothetical protein